MDMQTQTERAPRPERERSDRSARNQIQDAPAVDVLTQGHGGDRPDVREPVYVSPEMTYEEQQGFRSINVVSEDEARPKRDLDQFISDGNHIELVLGAFWGFVHSDWKLAYKKRGIAGLVVEFFRYVTSDNMAEMKFDRYSIWSGWAQEKLLKRHGIPLWDRHLEDHGRTWAYSIKKRHQKWAQYLLLRAGVPLFGEVDPKIRARAEAYRARALIGAVEKQSWWEILLGAAPTPAHSEPPNWQQQRKGAQTVRDMKDEDARASSRAPRAARSKRARGG